MSTDTEPTIDPARPFDPDALREKYRAERDKRLRAGRQRPVRRDGRRVRPLPRRPVRRADSSASRCTDEVDVVIIGGGFGGLLAGARLREAGIDDIRIIEKGGDFGGTWYWNRYPGAMCDVESYIYLPLLEEIGYMPKEKYSHAPEILEHSRAIGEHFDLYRNALLPDRGHRAALGRRRRRAGSSRTDRGDAHARPVRRAWRNGPLHRPEAARHPRHRDVRGPHVPHQPLGLRLHRRRLRRRTSTGLADKRVGIIGTGATAVQCVPHLGEARRAAVRLPAHAVVDRRARQPRRPTRSGPPALEPGWQQQRMDNFNTLVVRRLRRRGPRQRRLDRHHRQAAAHGPARTPPATMTAEALAAARWSWPTSRRWSRSAPASTTIVARPGDRRGAEAVLPPVLQAAVLPRRVPADASTGRTSRSSTPTARASSGSPRRRGRRTASSTSSTA